MRAWVGAISLLLAPLWSGCGGEDPGFRIDQVTISPDDLPVNSLSDEDVRIAALVFNDRHDVLEVLVRSDDAMLWAEMIPGRYPKWSVRIPVAEFSGYPIGKYDIDIEARDDANRLLVLENAVTLTIRED